MAYFKVFVFILTALVAVSLTAAQNNTGGQTSVVTDDVEKEEKSSLEKGMEPIFSLYQNFLTTVMSKSFYDSDTAFNVQKLNQIVKDNKYDELQKDWRDLVSTYGGIAACIICGLLFVVFMPLVGLIYCCCHCCCHKCGGTKETRDPKRAGCMRMTFSALLLICTTLVLVGCIITFLSSELLKRSLKDENNEGFLSTMDTNLGSLQTFANSTLKEVKDEATDKVMTQGLGKILPTIESAATHTVDKVMQLINATAIFDAADDLGAEAKKALADIEDIRHSLANLSKLQSNVTNKLADVKQDIDDTCALGTGGGVTGTCPDTSQLTFNPNFEDLEKLDSQLSNTNKTQDIEKYVKEAKDEFDQVSTRVDEAVNNSIQEARIEIQKINQTVNGSINELDGKADPFIESVQEGRDYIKKNRDTFIDTGNYIWYGCIGMGCAVLLVVCFYYLGVLFGLCGERPGFNAACCNRGTGANLLCAGIFFSFLFAAILMLVVILMFSLGGLGYTMACQYMNDGVENVAVFETVLEDGFEWNVSSTFGVANLSVAGMISNCKANQGLYTALHLQSIFDIDKEFNVTDVELQVKKMTDATFTIDNVTLLNTDLKAQLESLKTTNISGVNYTQYTEQLNKPLTGDLNGVISQLEAYYQSSKIPKLNKSIEDLRDLQQNEIAKINAEKTILEQAVTSLENHGDVSAEVDSLIASIMRAQDRFNRDKDTITKQELDNAVSDTLDLINTTVASAKHAIKYDIGKCEPLYTAAQNVADSVCIYTLDPFNAIWFGLGWSLFFYIPCLIFAALLSSLYQRTEKYGKKSFDEINYQGYAGYGGSGREDAMPLTSAGGQRRDQPNGNYNQGYDGRESVPESRYHRDGNYPDQGRGGHGGHVYDMPTRGPTSQQSHHDSPPHYDEAVSGGGYRYSGGGGYPKANRY